MKRKVNRMLRLILNSFLDIRKSWRKYLFFGCFYLIITSYVLIPFLGFFLHRLLLIVSSGVLLDTNAFSLLLDFRGFIGFFILSTLTVIFVFIEIGTLTILSYKLSLGKEVLVTESFITAIYSVKRIIGIGIIHLMAFFFMLIPIINLQIKPQLLKDIELPALLIENIMKSLISKFLYFGVVIFLFFIIIRFIFTVHEIVIENKTVRKAVKSSFKLTRRISFNVFVKLIIFNFLIFGIGTLVFTIISTLPNYLNFNVNYLVRNYILTLSSFLSFAFTLIIMPLNIIFLTKLYALVKEGDYIKDDLKTHNFRILKKSENYIYDKFKSKKVLLAGIFLIALIVTFYSGVIINEGVYTGRDVKVIAHRGIVNDEIENSIEAIKASLKANIDVVELDIQMTKDGEIILHHDRNLKRIFGVEKNIEELTYKEIIELEALNNEHFHYDGKLIATLDEALELIEGQIDIQIDVKTYGQGEKLANRIVTIIDKYDMIENAYIQSFDREFIERVEKLNSKIKTCQIMYYVLGDLSYINADYFTVEKGLLSQKLVGKARKEEKGIWVWTVNNEEDVKEVLQYDIDGIITKNPLMVKEILGREVE
ncbi:MAG: glycerophosphoryl diester phosphodiesterase membrane domain-containing protein [Bacillota bacterium]|nr:glycerophosphoryl diester phosphodiesterase membrane domain-containing protein [Bacillota bacterium]